MSTRDTRSAWRPQLAAVIPLLFLGAFVAWPLLAIVTKSFTEVSSGRAVTVLTRESTWRVVGFTLGQAALSAALTLLIGLPIAHVLATYRFPGSRVVRAITMVPFVLPTLVVAAAFSNIFSKGLAAILAAHVFFNVAVVVRVVGGFWSGLDSRQAESAATLGAGPWRVFRLVTLPRLRPVIVGSGALVFLFSFTSFGLILVLGGLGQATVETEIYRYAVSRGEFDVAAGLALLQLFVVVVLAVWVGRFRRQLSALSSGGGTKRSGARAVTTFGQGLHVASVVLAALLLVGAPLFTLVRRSLQAGSGYGFTHYRSLTQPLQLLPVTPARAMMTSVIFAFVAAAIALGVGLVGAFAARHGGWSGRLLEAAALVPLGVSAVTLGFGYLVGFTVFDLRSKVIMIPIAHAVIGVPFVLGAVAPALRAVSPTVTEAARSLGATPGQITLRIEWPLIRPAAITGAGFGVAVSLGEFGATTFLARGDSSFTAPIAIFRLLSQPGAELRGQAAALSVSIGILVALLGLVLEWYRDRHPGVVGLL